jgi:hypothetical protein
MKKNLFSLVAVAISLIAFSFTLPKKAPMTTFNFRFIGNASSESDVENEANWFNFTTEPTCDGVNHEVCEILGIPEAFTELVGNPAVRKMKSTVDIQSFIAAGLGTIRYVSSVNPAVVGETINNNSKL